MKRKVLEVGLAVATLLALAWAGYSFLAREEGAYVTVQPLAYQPDRPLPTGRVHTVSFRIDNRSRHSARVVGLVTC